MRPTTDDYASFYHSYVARVPDGDIGQILQDQGADFQQLLGSVPQEKEDYRYADGKWSIKQMVQHITDAERVFAYRLMSFSRREPQPLPGFDENHYANAAPVDHRSLSELTEEFSAVRQATLHLLGSLLPGQYDLRGIASDAGISVRGLAYIIAGHCAHHMIILRERYDV